MSDLLLMGGSSGLPRNGLVALYDPFRQYATTGAAQTLTDYSGRGNTGTLGATTNVGADDPTFGANSLTFGGDDYVFGPTTADLPIAGNFSAIVVAQLSQADTAKTIISFANASVLDQYFSVRSQPTNKIQVFSRGGSTSAYADAITINKSVVSAIYISRVGTTLTNTDLSNWATGTGTIVTAPTGTNMRIGIGTIASSSPADTVDSLVCYGVAVFNRGLSASEQARSYRYLKSLFAGRGVTLA